MAIHYRTKGFIFKKSDRFEADRLFKIFTYDFGKIEILARAIRKITSKLRTGADIFYLSDIEFIQGKTYKTLTDAIVLEKFARIKKSLKKLKISHKISRVLDNLLKGEEHDENIWQLLDEVFTILNEAGHYSMVYYFFLWNFFSILGYKPEVYKCALCQKKLMPYKLYFSDKEGGVICHACSRNASPHTFPALRFAQLNESLCSKGVGARGLVKINTDVVKILRMIFKKDWKILSKIKVEPLSKKTLKDISEGYYSYLLDIYSPRKGIM